jgi:DNA-binding response OmpR family regulator
MPAAVIDAGIVSPETSSNPHPESAEDRNEEPNRMRILSVSPFSEDHAALRRILDEKTFEILVASTRQEAVRRLRRASFSVVLCERDLTDGTWKDLLNHAGAGQQLPFLIVTSRLADDYLWAEVLNMGGYDVLAKPFRAQEVRHVVISAWARRQNPVRSAHSAGTAGTA